MIDPFDTMLTKDAETANENHEDTLSGQPGRPKKNNGFFATLTFQVILCLVIVIIMVLLNTFFPSQYNDIENTIKEHITQDGGFSEHAATIWDKFLVLINKKDSDTGSAPVSEPNIADGTSSILEDETSGEESASQSTEDEKQEASSQPAAGGEPADKSIVPANASVKRVSYNNSKNLILPLKTKKNVTSNYGVRTHPITGKKDFHSGMDFAADEGTGIRAVQSGTVAVASKSKGYGNYIKIKHKDGTYSLYAHCKELFKKKGQNVKRGEKIAAVGSTGMSTGPHLHFAFILNGKFVNPVYILENAGA